METDNWFLRDRMSRLPVSTRYGEEGQEQKSHDECKNQRSGSSVSRNHAAFPGLPNEDGRVRRKLVWEKETRRGLAHFLEEQ
jgi:hypothetical protein